MQDNDFIAGPDDLLLVTGAAGFIGRRVVENLLARGFRNVLCLTRSLGKARELESVAACHGYDARVAVGNLLSPEDCAAATKNVSVIYHLAVGRGEKSVPDAYMNSVVTTRNLLQACIAHKCLKRFVNVSSFAVYTNAQKALAGVLDETCPVENQPHLRGDAYSFAKIKQEEIVAEYGEKFRIPYVTLRPGYVYGPGNEAITARVGISTFGFFLHLGGSNMIPLTYVDNCAEAIVLAGLKGGIDGEIFNIVDDELPSSRQFLRLYKRNVKRFPSLYCPHAVSYALCYLWEWYSTWSEGQLPPSFNRKRWHSFWKKTRYSNYKLKERLGWVPTVPMAEALNRYFHSCREKA